MYAIIVGELDDVTLVRLPLHSIQSRNSSFIASKPTTLAAFKNFSYVAYTLNS